MDGWVDGWMGGRVDDGWWVVGEIDGRESGWKGGEIYNSLAYEACHIPGMAATFFGLSLTSTNGR